MDVPNNDQKAQYTSQKIGKFIFILIAIATFRWVSCTSTSLSLVSSFIQSSGKGSKLAKVLEQKEEREDEAVSTVLLLHYHKTGNNFIADLLAEIDKTYKQRRHDLAMKDPFMLNREIKKARNEEHNNKKAQDNHGGTEIEHSLRDQDDDGPKKQSKKQRNTKGAVVNSSDKVQTKKGSSRKNMSSNGKETKHPNASASLHKDNNSTRVMQKRDKNKRKIGQEANHQEETRKADASNSEHQKRSHDPLTGCPTMQDFQFDVGAAYRLTAPDLFCNLSQPVKVKPSNKTFGHDIESEVDVKLDDMRKQDSISLSTGRLPFPAWETTKIVHFVRDPFEMALSNYLYHSQYPTPEAWVLVRHLNPCSTNYELINYTLAQFSGSNSEDPSFPKANITIDDLMEVRNLCKYYRHDHPMGGYRPNMSKAFYPLLRKLPPYDGLRVATTQFLLAQNPQSGGDLLRMPNNMLRLREWEANALLTAARVESKRKSHILTVSMGDIVKDMKGSIQTICNFILGYMSNDTIRSDIAEDIAGSMVAIYNAKEQASKEIRLKKATTENEVPTVQNEVIDNTMVGLTVRKRKHVTQGLMNTTDRQMLKKQLENDPVLGSIMLQLRDIVNSVGSWT